MIQDPNAVEAALLFNEKKYPPMLPRILRVVRAKAVRKSANAYAASRSDPRPASRNAKSSRPQIYNPKVSSEVSSLKGRAGKLLGKAGAAQFNKKGSGANMMPIGVRGQADRSEVGPGGVAKTPESIVFEGFRASAKNGKPKDLKMGKREKKGPNVKGRGAKRASAWKKQGGKKAK
jgi:nucleolar protein 12